MSHDINQAAVHSTAPSAAHLVPAQSWQGRCFVSLPSCFGGVTVPHLSEEQMPCAGLSCVVWSPTQAAGGGRAGKGQGCRWASTASGSLGRAQLGFCRVCPHLPPGGSLMASDACIPWWGEGGPGDSLPPPALRGTPLAPCSSSAPAGLHAPSRLARPLLCPQHPHPSSFLAWCPRPDSLPPNSLSAAAPLRMGALSSEGSGRAGAGSGQW